MLFGFFSGDEFNIFKKNVIRIRKILTIADNMLLIEHFVELRALLRKKKEFYPN